ncbi:unnamed protein product [Mytilus edulis]|uniref:Uncharacterized protein n=1 Tax=Mytilus edulis TaxID=6550 RepID=A0A8S3TEN0_MYTED|nr:unnamed protein product [Mytilus edulis]
MSKQFFLRTPYSTHKLEPPDITSVIAVNGNHVKVLGKVNISVTIGNRNFRASIYVLPQLHHSLILGVDFLKQTKAKLNFETDTFEIFENNDVVTLSRLTSKQGLAKTSKAITIPKRSQTLISVAVSHQTHDSTVLLEPLKSLAHKHRILAAKALVKIKHGKAYLSLMNPTDNKVRIKARTKLAKVAHVKTETIQNFNDTKPSVSSIKTPNSTSCSDLKFDLSESDLTDSEKQKMHNFLNENKQSFATDMTELGKTPLYKHKIVTVPGARPVRRNPYRQSPQVRRETENQIQELLENGIIEESNSDWCSPLIMIPKKTGGWRMAIDYRSLNKLTVPMTYPLPHIESVFDALGEAKAKYFYKGQEVKDNVEFMLGSDNIFGGKT